MSRWAVVGVPDHLRHGGDLRARHLFSDLAERTNALVFYRPGLRMLTRAVRRPSSMLPGVDVAAAELLPQASVGLAKRLTRLRVLDLHDHPVHQLNALRVDASNDEQARLYRLTRENVASFERVVVVSESFADIAEVEPAKRVVISNGTDTAHIRPQPLPEEPVVGFISGASPGRGIELLVEAMRFVRRDVPAARLVLALSAPNAPTKEYLVHLRGQLSRLEWAQIESVPYGEINRYFARTTVVAIPHLDDAYMDAALPVKLFDSMAAGRPIIATPRTETSRVLESCSAGITAKSDAAEDLAEAIVTVIANAGLAQQMASNGRRAAVQEFDWRVLARRLSRTILM